MSKTALVVFTDGGSLNNPGPAAVGFVVKKGGKTIKKFAKGIGQATNNIAEYTAVIEALKWLKTNYPSPQLLNQQVNFFLDSRLVVNQLNGVFKIKDYQLRSLAIQVRRIEGGVGANFCYHYISRERNREADSLVKGVFKQL